VEDIEAVAPDIVALDDEEAIQLGVTTAADAYHILPSIHPGRDPRDIEAERAALKKHVLEIRQKQAQNKPNFTKIRAGNFREDFLDFLAPSTTRGQSTSRGRTSTFQIRP